eukprot:5873514-Alexandrium_andersonii.AAC.1
MLFGRLPIEHTRCFACWGEERTPAVSSSSVFAWSSSGRASVGLPGPGPVAGEREGPRHAAAMASSCVQGWGILQACGPRKPSVIAKTSPRPGCVQVSCVAVAACLLLFVRVALDTCLLYTSDAADDM